MERGFAFALDIPEYIIFRVEDKNIPLKEFYETQKSQEIIFTDEWTKELVDFINRKCQEKQKKLTTPKNEPQSSTAMSDNDKFIETKLKQAEEAVGKYDYKQAEEIYNDLLKMELPDKLKIALYDGMGELYYYQYGGSKTVLRYYQKALDLKINLFGKLDVTVADSYINIGKVYYNDKDNDNDKEIAEKYFDNALDIYRTELNKVKLENSYMNIGKIIYLQNNKEG
jgi:tetratricopeptide (TPR) repeat protein